MGTDRECQLEIVTVAPRGTTTYSRKGFVWRALAADSWVVEFHIDGGGGIDGSR